MLSIKNICRKVYILPTIECYIEDREETSRLSNGPTPSLMKQEVCDLIDNKDDKKTIKIMKKLKKILLTGLRKIEIRNK
jgi:hypothetical protein